MTKPELGAKRLCAHCGARFYDLLRTPIVCPKCSTTAVVEPPNAKSRLKSAPRPEREPEQPANKPKFAPFKDVAAEGDPGADVLPEAAGDDELDDAVLIDDDEQGDDDFDETAGDDADTREEN